MKEMIKATNISKKFKLNADDYIMAVDQVDVVINEGEFVCIMGPSGAGKSTLLNILSTLDLPTNGFLKVAEKNIIKMAEHELSQFRYEYLGFIFQDFSLIDIMTVQENIAVSLIVHNVPRDESNQRVKAIAERLGIGDLLTKYPNECSGGQLQRIAIARALVTEPKLIVADEPTGNLDSKNTHELMKLFREYNKEGKTVLIVTHDSMIASYASRVLYINDGKIEEEIIRGNKTKKEFFHKIVEVNSEETFIEG